MNRVCSIFSQLLHLFPRLEFQQAVQETRAERHARGFTCWGQFVAMLFCQLGQARSLREICGGLAACEGKLRHLGVPQSPNRSTLAYANEHRPWQLYQKVFGTLFARCQGLAGAQRRFRFRNPLLSIDGTIIEPNTNAPRERPSCTWCWITTATCPALRSSRKAKPRR
jgi:hypothetical protein